MSYIIILSSMYNSLSDIPSIVMIVCSLNAIFHANRINCIEFTNRNCILQVNMALRQPYRTNNLEKTALIDLNCTSYALDLCLIQLLPLYLFSCSVNLRIRHHKLDFMTWWFS